MNDECPGPTRAYSVQEVLHIGGEGGGHEDLEVVVADRPHDVDVL